MSRSIVAGKIDAITARQAGVSTTVLNECGVEKDFGGENQRNIIPLYSYSNFIQLIRDFNVIPRELYYE